MPLEVCFAYQWATYGGVERVFLNRALALRSYGDVARIDVYYGADAGGLASFRRAIGTLGLDDTLRVVDRLVPSRYDIVSVIDSPDLMPSRLTDACRWLVECHTPYADNRAYLDRLPAGVECVAVPSRTFAATVRAERPGIAKSLRLLRNCVAPMQAIGPVSLPAWSMRPVLYFGRLDDLKNPQGLIDLLAELERRAPGRYFGVALGPELAGYGFAQRVDAAGLRGRVFQLPALDFLRTSAFLAAWKDAGGVMVSPSRGESFGLAAAEAIASGVPVLLSRLPEHSELLGGDQRHMYNPADPADGADRLESLFEAYAAGSKRMLECAKAFDDAAFIADWRDLVAGGQQKSLKAEVAGDGK